jgi:hypothetical protein
MDSMSNLSDMVNTTKAFYAQLSIRPAYSQKKLIQNIELAVRFSLFAMTEPYMNENILTKSLLKHATSPEPAALMADLRKTEFAIGINYWFGWRTVLKIAYANQRDEDGTSETFYYAQLALAHPKINFKRKNK